MTRWGEIKCPRCEELETKLRKSALQELAALDQASEAYQAQLAVEAKLAKAVEELENMQKVPRSDASYGILMVMISYTLAELTGGNDE